VLPKVPTTFLSCVLWPCWQQFCQIPRLARHWLRLRPRMLMLQLLAGVALAPTLSGCLLAEPPEFEPARKVAPRLNYNAADPPLTQILRVSSGQSVQFTLPFQSQDFASQEEPEFVLGVLVLDYRLSDSPNRIAGPTFLPPDSLGSTREMKVSWVVGPGLSGCHQVSLLVGHLSRFDGQSNLPKPGAEVSIAVWWANVNPSLEQPDTLFDCPPGGGGGN
jgi:hypothetical protein